MTICLQILSISPAATLQDLGRENYLAFGLSKGGAVDTFAVAEGAALLENDLRAACVEMPGIGGTFKCKQNMRIALTGAPMPAMLDGNAIAWNASHLVRKGQTLELGAARRGIYAYLHVQGGIEAEIVMNARSAHLAGGIGQTLKSGDELSSAQPDAYSAADQPHQEQSSTLLNWTIDRFSGGIVRILPGLHADAFAEETLQRFGQTVFQSAVNGNRQGVQLNFDGEPFASSHQLSGLSQPMVPGDIQMTGAGLPFALLTECQTMGGYPRIATIVPNDLAILAQSAPGVDLQFQPVSLDDARARHQPIAQYFEEMKRNIEPLVRDPAEIADLLAYQLISGAIAGTEFD